MTRNLIMVLCFLAFVGKTHAQTPQYGMPFFKGAGIDFGAVGNFGGNPPFRVVRIQSIYTTDLFPTAPNGTMSNIYLRVYRRFGTAPCVYDSFSVKIGYAYKDTFDLKFGTQKDSFLKLTTVFKAKGFVIQGADTQGKWIKIPLTLGSFNYIREQSFAVEVTGGVRTLPNGIELMLFNAPYIGVRTISDTITAAVSKESAPGVLNLGFDFKTTGVDAVSNITSFGLFPNPCTDGYFNISFDTKQSMKEVSIKVSDATGRQVYARSYAGTGTSFFKEVDIRGAAKGLYFVKVVADGEVITRRVVME